MIVLSEATSTLSGEHGVGRYQGSLLSGYDLGHTGRSFIRDITEQQLLLSALSPDYIQ